MNRIILKMRAPLIACGLWVAIAITQSASAKINVVVSIKPIHSLVAGVMQGVGAPDLLLEAGSPHNYALKPSNARALQNADVVFWVGPNMERFLVEPLKSLASNAAIIALISAPRLALYKVRKDPAQLGSTDPHLHTKQPHQLDPHIWLDPFNAKILVGTISATLERLDPTNAAIYKHNAIGIKARLTALSDQIKRQLAPLRDRPFLTFHDSNQYFEKRFHLNMKGSIAISPDRPPGVRHLNVLRKRMKGLEITCVFSEPQFRSSLVDLVIEGSRARTANLDPLGARIKKGPQLYFSLLKNNARAFVSCLGN